MSDEKTTLDCWALVELFGHQKIAGKVTEQTIAGAAMLRVDVPECGPQAAYTRYFGHGAIYSINPTTEEIARGMAARCSSEPVSRYELPAITEKAVTVPDDGEYENEDDEDREF